MPINHAKPSPPQLNLDTGSFVQHLSPVSISVCRSRISTLKHCHFRFLLFLISTYAAGRYIIPLRRRRYVQNRPTDPVRPFWSFSIHSVIYRSLLSSLPPISLALSNTRNNRLRTIFLRLPAWGCFLAPLGRFGEQGPPTNSVVGDGNVPWLIAHKSPSVQYKSEVDSISHAGSWVGFMKTRH